MNIHTVLFDLDGTLIDTNELIIASFTHTFKHYELNFTREEIIEFNGPPLVETFTNIDPDRVDEMIDVYREHNLRVHDNYVEAFPYVLETLKQLKERDIKIGIVTTKMTDSVNRGLKIAKLEGLFDTMVTLDDVTHPKPHPEPVLKAMKALDAKASTTLIVGDNSHDIESGQNAGVKTAGVAWSFKGRERLQQLNPTYMLEDMRDLLKIVGG
ncbi:pyrophosphatase PpaX [Oceanobacillus piezotolerans]|uniref:Pyrophosphatase PpaX n=1 Tax=Oceanobacillus piezotolerans TaxID=2448030 RepID=A0A498D7G5_9BACI|nr:pyrophosphatase PpaX [Oceanobacillus piezotolerans]RLL46635.1 pyrophosphatase PpaX [Oceanobacillus piezotolerans]